MPPSPPSLSRTPVPTLDRLTGWLADNPALLGAVGALSVLLLAATVLATPWLVARLPADYFSAPPAPLASRGARRLALLAARNAAGLAFMTLGLVMMVTPGPGVVAFVLGLSLCEFPGKHALLVRLAARPDVFRSLNWLRRRGNAPPFRRPGNG